MHERITLNGAPVVGFGSESSVHLPVLGAAFPYLLVGSVGGALLGHHIRKGVGTVIGAVAGGAVGGVVWFGVHFSDSGAPGPSIQKGPVSTTTPPASTWKRIPIEDVAKLKAGQQYAVAVALANGAPLLPADIAAIDLQFTALKTAPVNLPFKNFASYPPGAKLPSDWPTDDDLGPNAYRISADLTADAPADSAGLKNLNTESFTADGLAAEVWVRG